MRALLSALAGCVTLFERTLLSPVRVGESRCSACCLVHTDYHAADGAGVDSRIFGALNNAGIVYDGGLVVDGTFCASRALAGRCIRT